MRLGLITIAILGLGLASCQNVSYVMETYSKPGKQVLKTDQGDFWIFDRPDLGKMLTTPGPGTAFGIGVASGMTLGIAKVDPVVQFHQTVALTWFASTGRTCEIKTSSEILRPEYEHTYVCK